MAAVVIAAAMVAGSLALRARLDDDDGDGSKTSTGAVVCATELAGVCEAIGGAVTIEAAGVTADRLTRSADVDADLDAWIVTAPWPRIVEERRSRAGLDPMFDKAVTLARSPLVVVADKAALGTCKAWRCLGETAAAGRVSLAHGSADGAVSLLVLGHAVSGFLGRTDLSSADLDDPAFDTWFSGMERAIKPDAFDDPDPLQRMLTARGTYSAVATSEADAQRLLRGADRSDLTLLYPAPVATAALVVVPFTGHRADVERIRAALVDTCWRGSACAGTTPLPEESGLPDPGLLDALRARWKETVGR